MKAQSHCVNYNGGLNINLRLNMKPEYNLDIALFSAWGRLDGVRWQYKEMAESLIKKRFHNRLSGQTQFSIIIVMVGNFEDTILIILVSAVL